ncbi:phosphoglycerate dehydrogenase [Limosilactobacillus sp.]|jgi:D-3-phosphoglycerate dehydrogenase|uniref:phosphoglycerate dehydrogenase n=1 Tax=Limosilactobacillus sp. TaxID=2773925 RepID=UPI0025B9CB07|nr:phosphoglycerate dehydrogenase [Limosilactobacillus sp.]MCH3921279.1 phosphoglycerate dehydrogenase [Limosilactobacillus sp.]MCH3928050.1 phosphoglycerate dehydrogenase [Limosilactobacillus sp.]
MYNIKTYNAIAQAGLAEFTDDYRINQDAAAPDAYMIRSVDLHDQEFPASLKVIARCGAGFNNIPLDRALEDGIAVFNTPGGNANAVKELVLAIMIDAKRNLINAANWSASAAPGADITLRTEKQKTQFSGTELLGKKLAILGLGHVGSLVANAAIDLGMDVTGYDPYLSVDSAWHLSPAVKRAATIKETVAGADFITVHVPKNEETTGLIGAKEMAMFKPGAVLLNYSRLGIVDNAAVLAALENGQVAHYSTDFSDEQILGNDQVTITPHIGGSTKEATANCARIAAREIMDYLATGNTANSVNLPNVKAPFAGPHRFTIIHRNVPNMLGQITTVMADNQLNIENLVNRSRDKYAYTIVDISDLDAADIKKVTAELEAIDAVSRVRYIKH